MNIHNNNNNRYNNNNCNSRALFENIRIEKYFQNKVHSARSLSSLELHKVLVMYS